MPKTRKTHPPALKAKEAVQAIRAQRTTSEIAQMYAVMPMSRRDLLDGNPERCEIPGPARNTLPATTAIGSKEVLGVICDHV